MQLAAKIRREKETMEIARDQSPRRNQGDIQKSTGESTGEVLQMAQHWMVYLPNPEKGRALAEDSLLRINRIVTRADPETEP